MNDSYGKPQNLVVEHFSIEQQNSLTVLLMSEVN